MDIGTVFHRSGQRYEIIDDEPYYLARQDRCLLLWRVRSHCVDCDGEFDFLTTKTRARRTFSLNRRCERHHSPGKAVTPSQARRAARWECKRARRAARKVTPALRTVPGSGRLYAASGAPAAPPAALPAPITTVPPHSPPASPPHTHEERAAMLDALGLL
jgi:hypothetical protein